MSNAFAPFLVLSPQSQIAPVESTVTFTALAVGDPAPTYQWAWDGTNLASATNPTFILPNFQSGDSGTYWVTVSSSSGSETSAPVKLTVEGPAITVTVASEKNGDIVINVYRGAGRQYRFGIIVRSLGLAIAANQFSAIHLCGYKRAGHCAPLLPRHRGALNLLQFSPAQYPVTFAAPSDLIARKRSQPDCRIQQVFDRRHPPIGGVPARLHQS